MATKKTATKKKPTSRQLTAIERKALKENLYKYINRVDTLSENKNINVQVRSNLKKFKKDLSTLSRSLTKF